MSHICYEPGFDDSAVECRCIVGADHTDDACEDATGHAWGPA